MNGSVKVALHICCGVCTASVAERLFVEGYQVLGFFYNPNIHPAEEYEKRLKAACKVARELNFPLEVGDYAPKEWFTKAGHLKDELEGGKRCEV